MRRELATGLLLILSTPPVPAEGQGEWSGYLSAEARYFAQSPRASEQPATNLSLAFEPEYYYEWDDGYQSFTFKPFVRIDQHDVRRTHGDIRELVWGRAGPGWELRAGISKVFWGVAEALHLIDIVNQTDLVENPDGEQKLGQPMVKLSLEREWGTFDFFLLPGFRERTYPGGEGRFRTQPHVDVRQAQYESDAEERHVDYAVRWSHVLGDWDIGLAHFHGTTREPQLLSAGAVLIPYYKIIDQTGLDLQATLGNWLWKLEALHRSGQGRSYYAATGGFEYTLVGAFDSDGDLGVLAEYMMDERQETAPSPFQKDLFLGVRWTANDVQDSTLLAGVILDLDGRGRLFNIEASRRLGSRWKLALQGRAWASVPVYDPLYALRRDDYLELTLAWYF